MSPAPGGAASAPLLALEASGLGQAMRQWLWLYPSVETVHIVGIGLLFGSIAVLDLRLLGFSKSMSVKRLASHVLPWTAASFLVAHQLRSQVLPLIIPSVFPRGLTGNRCDIGAVQHNPVFTGIQGGFEA